MKKLDNSGDLCGWNTEMDSSPNGKINRKRIQSL